MGRAAQFKLSSPADEKYMTGSVAPDLPQGTTVVSSVGGVPQGPTGLWAALASATAVTEPVTFENTDELLAHGAHLSYLARLGSEDTPPSPPPAACADQGDAIVISLDAARARLRR